MNFWWVNQGQTSAHEIGGGYLWSPKLSSNGRRQAAYENMKDIEPGDLILAYSGMVIGHYGIATGRALSSPKPQEFGKLGSWWSNDGWYVSVTWMPIAEIERDAIAREAQRLFDEFENPFDVNGRVQQRYLFRIPKKAADFVLNLARVSEAEFMAESLVLEPVFFVAEAQIDGLVEKAIEQNTEISTTEKEAVVMARRGQGQFRDNLNKVEKRCRLTGVDDQRLLIASHIKPWRSCETNHERLDGNNGLLLTPTMDRLFDRRYLTFEDSGDAVLSKKIAPETYERIGLDSSRRINVGAFGAVQSQYLKFHREIYLG